MDEDRYHHSHKWMFLTTKGYYRPSGIDEDARDLYVFDEYAIMICNGCHNVIREPIRTKAQVDADEEHRS